MTITLQLSTYRMVEGVLSAKLNLGEKAMFAKMIRQASGETEEVARTSTTGSVEIDLRRVRIVPQ